ncbi:hypothetical protein GCM10011506_07800 [Marivirga lumbricoides]|uniref:DNA polymerase III subunit gamma/tau n=1 Tax=Marivirga lumbricoides TaxID=1046115 RepID=A0ABQ1LLG7_9BACT|nr:hypothetical protein GCM10011506_07800 [Marivirga lumbricoides]
MQERKLLTFNEENIKLQLKEFLEKEKNNIGALSANALTNSFKLDGNSIIIQLTNLLEVDAIEQIKADLINYLRGAFGIAELQLNHEVSAQNAIERPYTPKEKLEAMMKKNPALEKLKEKFGLDTDF